MCVLAVVGLFYCMHVGNGVYVCVCVCLCVRVATGREQWNLSAGGMEISCSSSSKQDKIYDSANYMASFILPQETTHTGILL